MIGRRLPPLAGALSLALAAMGASQGAAQVPVSDSIGPIEVQIVQVAGSNIYFEVGTAHGLAAGDTLEVRREAAGASAGRLVVVASTSARSVLTFVDGAFALTRGDRVWIVPRRPPSPEAPAPGRPLAPSSVTPTRIGGEEATEPTGRRPARGRWRLDLAASRSTTRVGGADPIDVRRTFATPSLRLDATVPELVGRFRFRTSMRLAYRYSDREVFSRGESARIYLAALDGRLDRIPLSLTLGRFHSPAESYSGYWDGVMLRYGPERLGVGVLLGFRPDRWNETPSLDVPKGTLFIDAERRGSGWRWTGDLSAHTVRPTDGSDLLEHTFLGLSQRLSLGAWRLSQDLQVDRAPEGGGWRVTELRLRTSVRVSPSVELRLGGARDERFRESGLAAGFTPRRDRFTAGVGVHTGSSWAGVDLAATHARDGETSRGITGSWTTAGSAGTRGITGTVSYWDGERGRVVTAAPAVFIGVGGARLRIGYRLFRSDYLDRVTTVHGGDLSLDWRLTAELLATGALRGQWGGGQRSENLHLGLSRSF